MEKNEKMHAERIALSVIIPVYNTPARDIDRMMVSVLDQDMPAGEAFEVIIIDDGSKEECASFLDGLMLRNDKIQVVHTENRGVSEARNKGKQLARGDYLTFVDADDYLMQGFFAEALKTAYHYKADIVYGTIVFEPSVFTIRNQNTTGVDCYTGNDINLLKAALLGYTGGKIKYTINQGPYGRLFKKETAKKVQFREDIRYFEDQIFNHEMLNASKVVVATPGAWYCYVQNDYSALHGSYKENQAEVCSTVFDALNQTYRAESSFIRAVASIDAMDKYCSFVLKDCVYVGEPIKTTIEHMKRNIQHPYIQSSLREIKTAKEYMTIKDHIQFFLLKHRNYLAIIMAMKILYRKEKRGTTAE